MKTILEEIENVVATVVPHPVTAATHQAEFKVKPEVLAVMAETKIDLYPSCLDLAAEFMARG